MIVSILKDIFEDDSNTDSLDKLWHVIEGQHRLVIKEDEDIEALMESGWYNTSRKTVKEVIFVQIVSALQSSPLTSQVTISNKGEEHFSIKEATAYLKQPFIIILENSNNDAPFLDALLQHFPKQGKIIRKHKEERWLKYGMGGGTTIPDVIRSEIISYESDIFTKEKHRYLRYFVIIDSDREYPEMEIKQDKQNLIAFLIENNIKYHILEKREMENYLPDEAFEQINNNKGYVDAYIRLTPIQKDYFDIQNGLPNKRFEQLPTEIQQIFQGLTIDDKRILRSDNLEKINTEERRNFKTEFPKLFLSNKVTKESLLKRCAHHFNNPKTHPYDPDELSNLLIKITELL